VFGNSYRPRFDLVVNLLTAKAFQEKVITIYNGQQWRPFLHVDDAANGFLEVLNAPPAVTSGEIFNLGDSRLNYTLAQVAEKIQQTFPGTQVEHIENADRRNYRVSFDKIRDRIGFEAARSLEDGIEELRQAFADGTIVDYTDPLYHNQRFLQRSGSPANMNAVDTQVMAAFAGELSK
jgi:nucleoside-diphosphate-sugar epimerase